MPSSLQSIKARIDALPAKRAYVDTVGTLQAFADLASEAATSLRLTQANEDRVRAIFPNASVDAATRPVEKAVLVAQRLLPKLTTPDAASGREVDKRLTTIREHAQSAANAVDAEWNAQVGRKVADHKAIAAAASQARVSGGAEFQLVVGRLERQATHIPQTDNEIEIVRADLDALTSSIGKLGLEGKARDFLISVAERRGNPAHVIDPEVRAFLEKHNLWSVLVVSFR